MIPLAIVSLLASTVLCVVAYRLAMLPRCHPSLGCRVRWHSWVATHGLIGYGCLGFIFAPLTGWHVEPTTLAALFAGIAISLWPRKRRSPDR